MTHTAGSPLGGAPGASRGAGDDVVDVGSALHPTAVHAPSFVPLCVPRRRHLTWHLPHFGGGGLRLLCCLGGVVLLLLL